MSTPENTDKPLGEVTGPAIIAVCFLAAIMIAAVVALELAGRPVTNVLVIITAIMGVALPALLQSRKSDKARAVLETVAQNTNGRLSGLLDDRALLENQVRELGHVPVTLPAPRLTTETPDVAAQQGTQRGQHRSQL